MKRLLVIAHAPSPNTVRLKDAALAGAAHPDIAGVESVWKPPLEAGPDDVLAAGAVLFGTTENLGYMAGALKDFFDRSFYALLDRTDAFPYGLYVRAGHDGTGTRRAVESICSGLRWKPACAPKILQGSWDDAFVSEAEELGTFMAAGLEAGLF